MTHATRARIALANLAETDPALGALALWCRHRDVNGATHTDGDCIGYGADFETHPLPQQVGVAAHHVLHVALRHSERAASARERIGPQFSTVLFGLAADAIVNETLIVAEHAIPRPCPRLSELLDKIGEPTPSPLAALTDWDTERLALRLHRDEKTRKAAEEYGTSKQFVPDLNEGQDGNSADNTSDWRGHVLRALETGRQAGTGIGVLGVVVADMAPPRIPWERQLRGLLSRALVEMPQQTWKRPSGRWAALEAQARRTGGTAPVFQPGQQRTQERPRIVVGLDTSSSIALETLRLFTSEADGIARRTGAETHLLGFDTAVHTEKRLRPGERISFDALDMRVGGGTHLQPVLVRAAQLSPSVAVILTDLDAPAGPKPDYPVIWVAPEGTMAPDFGTLLTL